MGFTEAEPEERNAVCVEHPAHHQFQLSQTEKESYETNGRMHFEVANRAELSEVIGESSALKNALNLVSIVAPTDSSVLILGETGTGKELIARRIHNLSRRRGLPFVKLTCAAIPLGLFEG